MELVPFNDRNGWIWWNGALVPWRDAQLHVLTHGLHYASAVFEGERAYAGNIFRLRDHTDRLINSGRILSFEIPYSAEQIDAVEFGPKRPLERDAGNQRAIHQLHRRRVSIDLHGAGEPDAAQRKLSRHYRCAAGAGLRDNLNVSMQRYTGIVVGEDTGAFLQVGLEVSIRGPNS